MKKALLLMSLVGSYGQIMSMDKPKNPKRNKELVSICLPKLQKEKRDPVPFFQLAAYTERIMPNIVNLLDDQGRVNLQTDIELDTVQDLIFSYGKKNIVNISNIMQILSPAQTQDIFENVCKPL